MQMTVEVQREKLLSQLRINLKKHEEPRAPGREMYYVYWKTINRCKVHMHLVGEVSTVEDAYKLLAANGFPAGESWASDLPRTGYRSAGPVIREWRHQPAES